MGNFMVCKKCGAKVKNALQFVKSVVQMLKQGMYHWHT